MLASSELSKPKRVVPLAQVAGLLLGFIPGEALQLGGLWQFQSSFLAVNQQPTVSLANLTHVFAALIGVTLFVPGIVLFAAYLLIANVRPVKVAIYLLASVTLPVIMWIGPVYPGRPADMEALVVALVYFTFQATLVVDALNGSGKTMK